MTDTIAADSSLQFRATITLSGYTPIGIVNVDTNDEGKNIKLLKFSNSSQTVYARFANTHSQPVNVTVTFRVLYKKSY